MAWTSPKTWSSAVLSSTEMNTHLRDNLLAICSTTGNLTITTVGPHGLGASPVANLQFAIGGTFTPSAANSAAVYLASTLNAAAGFSAQLMQIAGTIVEAGASTHPLFTSLIVNAPTITPGAATLTDAASLYVNGVPTGATNNYALFIETGADDGIHVAVSNTDVAHGITSLAPTSVYFLLRKASATAGGVSMQGFSETLVGLALGGFATTTSTTEATGSNAAVEVGALLKSGTATTAFAADDNIVAFKNNGNATHIFKGNGDSYEDGAGWTAYDTEDDRALIDAIDFTLDKALRSMRSDSAAWMAENETSLERLGIVAFNRDTDSRPYVNKSRLAMLHNGAIRLMGREILDLKRRLEKLGG